ncbi:hypothetical protein Tco_1534732, partial [Tanacetum coccineum]
MELFAFIRHSDPTKVRIGKRDLAKREVKPLKMTEGRTVLLDPPATAASGGSGDNIDKLFDEGDDAGQEHSVKKDDDVLEETIGQDVFDVAVEKAKKKQKRKVTGDASGFTHPPKKLRDDYQPVPPNTSGKSLAALCGLVSDGSNDSHHSGSYSEASVVTVAVTTTVVADVASIPGLKARVESKNIENVRDFASAGGANADAAIISKWKVTNDSILEDLYVCRDLTDRLASLALFAQLRVCLGAEVRMRAKHTLEKKGELEDKCAEQAALLSKRNTEIVHLKSLLSLKETERVERFEKKNVALEGERYVMSEKIATLESVNAAKEAELASLSSQVAKLTSDLSNFQLSCDELNSQVASLESERDGLINQ